MRPDVTFYFGRIDMQVATGDGVARERRREAQAETEAQAEVQAEAKATTAGARRYADTLALVTLQHDFQT